MRPYLIVKRVSIPLGLSLYLAICTTHAVFACTCLQSKSPGEELNRASAVFVGEVSSLKAEKHHVAVMMKVEKVWKGEIAKTITVETSKWESDCGFSFSVGKKYLIYVSGKEPFNVSLCSRSKLLDAAAEDLKELGEGKPPN